MVLILDLHSSTSLSQQNILQEEKDWNHIESIALELRKISDETTCMVAPQGAQVLEHFLAARRGCPNPDSHGDAYQAIIPYFGKITLMPGKDYWSSSTPVTRSHSSFGEMGSVEFGADTLISFDSYLETLNGDPYPWQDHGIDWASSMNIDLHADWSWFLNGQDTT